MFTCTEKMIIILLMGLVGYLLGMSVGAVNYSIEEKEYVRTQ